MSRLALVVDGARLTVDACCVVRIDEEPAITPLPLAAAGVQGLTVVDGRPAVLVGGSGSKVVALSCEGGFIAMRASAVEACALDDLGSIDLHTLAPWARLVPPSPSPIAAAAGRGPGGLMALRVVAGGEPMLVPAEGVLRVTQVESSHDDGRLALVDGRLRRARSLSRMRGGPAGAARNALFLDGEDEVITVESVAGLALVPDGEIQSVPAGDGHQRRWWQVKPDGAIVEFLAVGGVLEKRPEAPSTQGPALVAAGRFRIGGLRLTCGAVSLVVPLDGVRGILDATTFAWQSGRVRRGWRNVVPVADFRRLIPSSSTVSGSRTRAIVLAVGGSRPVIALADEAALDSGDAAFGWTVPPPLPPGPAALIDGLRPDERISGLAFRLRLAPPSPFALRPAIAAALVGWADAGVLHAISRPPTAVPSQSPEMPE